MENVTKRTANWWLFLLCALLIAAALGSAGGGRRWGLRQQPFLVNLNDCTIAQLCALPGIGEKRAEAILAYRRQSGDFTDPRQLLEVPGIGKEVYEEIEKFIAIR